MSNDGQIGSDEFGKGLVGNAHGGSATFGDVAQQLRRNGYYPFPVKPLTKRPAVRGWNKPESSRRIPQWVRKFPNYNVGILGGSCVAFDIDADDLAKANELHALVAEIFGGNPLERRRGPTRRVLLYRAWPIAGTSHYNGFDIIGQKAQFVGFGTHSSGSPYYWKNGSPQDRPLIDLPPATPESLEALQDHLDKLLSKRTEPKRIRQAKQVHMSTLKPLMTKGTLIADGRDAELARCVWHVWATGEHDPDRIAKLAFDLFVSHVEMTRPKRDGTEAWSLQDAYEKAVYLLNSGKARPKPGYLASPDSSTTDPVFDIVGFNTAVSEISSLSNLSRAADRISRVMAGLAAQSGVCFAAAKTLAKWLDLNEDTVTKQRTCLVTAGLWTRTYDASKACGMAEFRPQVAFAIDKARGVVAEATRRSSWGDEEEEISETYENQIKNNYVGSEFRELGGTELS